MCLAIPMKILERDGNAGLLETGGVRRKADLSLVPDAGVGQYVIVHAGFAIATLDEDEALQNLALLAEIAEAAGVEPDTGGAPNSGATS